VLGGSVGGAVVGGGRVVVGSSVVLGGSVGGAVVGGGRVVVGSSVADVVVGPRVVGMLDTSQNKINIIDINYKYNAYL
jgi:hypothetical protein